MSDTDKDLPGWVRAVRDPNRVESHSTGCLLNPLRRDSRMAYRRYLTTETVVEVRTSPHDPDITYTRTVEREVVRHGVIRVEITPHECDIESRNGRCRAWLSDGHRCDKSRDDRHLLYFAPERASVRDALRAARDEYNTFGDTDIEPDNRQHRHAVWGGGWWD